MQLNENEQKELKTLYRKLSTLYKEKAKLEVLKKGKEEKLKEELASACNIKNKKGEIQSSKIKMPLVNAILNELYQDKPNKKEEEISIYENYKLAIKNKEVSEALIKSYISNEESIEENAYFIKEVYKYQGNILLSKELLNALASLLKDEYKFHLNDELIRQGYEVKEPKDKAELLKLKELIKSLIG